MIAAAGAGLMAEGIVEHDEIAHQVMQRHKMLALITLALFALLAIWRFARRNVESRREQTVWSIVAGASAVLLVLASQYGGKLVFDHAMGVPSATLRDVLERRGEMPVMQPVDSAAADSIAASGARPHRDPPGTRPHSH